MPPKSSHIAYLLDAESLLGLVNDRLKEAARQAIRRKDIKAADAIGELQNTMGKAGVILYSLLANLETPIPYDPPIPDGTPLGYEWKALEDHVYKQVQPLYEEDEEDSVDENRITIIPEE